MYSIFLIDMLLILILNIFNGQKSSKFVIMVENRIIHLTI